MATVMVVSFGLMPLVSQYWMLYMCSFLTTLGSGAFDCGTYVWIIELWGDKYEPILHSTQMMFGLATIVGPVFMTPFVKGDVTKHMNRTMNATERQAINFAIDRREQLREPFLIAAGIALLSKHSLDIYICDTKDTWHSSSSYNLNLCDHCQKVGFEL